MLTHAGITPPSDGRPEALGRLPGPDAPERAMPKGGGLSSHPIQPPSAPRVSYDPIKLQDNLRAAIEHLNQQLASSGRTLGFAMDDTLNSPVVTVRSTQTGEVIRQIHSEAVIRVAHTLDELKGLLHDAVS